MIGKTIHGYTIQYSLDEGGMAEVWYAENSLGNPVAIKIVLKRYMHDPDIAARFLNEAITMQGLNHPNIRRVIDQATIDGRICIIMEYLSGQDLSKAINKKIKFTDAQLIKWWNQLVEAVKYMHSRGIIHRDIKPSNIFITSDGDAKLLDFGIAKTNTAGLTQTGQMLGTLLYMSPEQINDPKRVTYKTDTYSLAVSFFHALSGKQPYGISNSSDYEVQTYIISKPLNLELIRVEWRNTLKTYLHKKPADRKELALFSEEPKIKKPKTALPPWIKTVIPSFLGMVIIWIVWGQFFHINKLPGSALLGTGRYPDGLMAVQKVWKNSTDESFSHNAFGFIDSSGKEVIACTYDYAADFSEEMAAVGKFRKDMFDTSKNKTRCWYKYGFIDLKNNLLIDYKYDHVHSFSEGLAAIKRDGKWGFINRNDNEVIAPQFFYATGFCEGLALVIARKPGFIFSNNGYGFIDKTGKEVIGPDYDYADDFSGGLAHVVKNKKHGFINKTGAEMIPLQYTDAGSFCENLAYVSNGYNYGFINRSNQTIIPFQYSDVKNFSEGLAPVKKNGKWGFVDKTGNMIIDCKYNSVEAFINGVAKVWLKGEGFFGEWIFIDTKGNSVVFREADGNTYHQADPKYAGLFCSGDYWQKPFQTNTGN